MATPSEKLAESLEVLHALQKRGAVAIRSGDLTRTHRERLCRKSVDTSNIYMAALEYASVDQNIVPFADFLAELVDAELKGKPTPRLPSSKS